MDDECAVLRACLNELVIGKRQVVIAQTTPGKRSEALAVAARKLRGIRPDTIDNFFSKNHGTTPLVPPLELDERFTPVQYEALEKLLSEAQGWEQFRKQYPETLGIIQFGRVGLSPDSTQALVYLERHSNWLSGSAAHHLFIREGDYWNLIDSAMVWIS